jgi:hypothetical protein
MYSQPTHYSVGIFLKTKLRFIIAILFMCLLSSCTDKGKMYDNFWGGMYNGANQMQEMKNQEPVPPAGEDRLTPMNSTKKREKSC